MFVNRKRELEFLKKVEGKRGTADNNLRAPQGWEDHAPQGVPEGEEGSLLPLNGGLYGRER